MKPRPLKLLTALFISGSLLTSGQQATAREFAYCDHEVHDSLKLRKQAAIRSFWRDSRASHPDSWIRFKILGFNDFHGQLEATTLFNRPVGGAAVLASYFQQETNESQDGAIIVHAGDHVGASPPISALLQDEPSISFLNLLTNKSCRYKYPMNPRCNLVGTLGNHEFDEGIGELTRLIDGGIHPDGPFLDEHYAGAKFPYVVANVLDNASGKPLFAPYVIKKVKGIPIAFIGAVLKETPSIVTPSGVQGVSFLDEADAINSYIPQLKRRGVRAIVVTIHQGARQPYFNGPTNEEPEALLGSIGEIVNRLDDEIDIVISGHAHGFTNQITVNQQGKQILVTQAFARGTAYADIDVAIDPKSRDIVEKSSAIITTYGDIGPGLHPIPEITMLVEAAAAKVAPLVNRIVGTAETDILRQANSAGESALGNLIADAQRAAMNTDFAFMNPGGIRSDILAGETSWGDLFTVQPFNNDLVKMELSGEQIMNLLNQQWQGQTRPRILKTSGLSYTWDNNRPLGDRIVDLIKADGTPVAPGETYTVTVNSFIAAGGDNFTVLMEGANAIIGPVDLDALATYIENLSQPYSASIEGRILRVN